MLNKQFISKIREGYAKHGEERRQIISLANVVLHDSKRVIFSLHRGDMKKAEESLVEIEKILADLEKKFGHNRLIEEGAYKAGVEEYVEAKMFYMVVADGKIDKITSIELDPDSLLGGISDVTGEMVRMAVNQAAAGNFKEVEKMRVGINDIMADLVEFDMTGYLRTKYDQAKNNLRKMEQIAYELKIRSLQE